MEKPIIAKLPTLVGFRRVFSIYFGVKWENAANVKGWVYAQIQNTMVEQHSE